MAVAALRVVRNIGTAALRTLAAERYRRTSHRSRFRPAGLLAALLVVGASAMAQIAGLDGEYSKTDIEIEVENGTTMYALVREFYPSRMNRWLAVAADIAAVNPQAFRNGDPANMIVGRTLMLIDYGDGIANLPEATEPAASADPPAETAATVPAVPQPSPSTTDPVVTSAPEMAAGSATATPAPDTPPPGPAIRIGRIDQLDGTPVIIDASGAQRAVSLNDGVHVGDQLVAGDGGRIALAMIDRAAIEVMAGGRLLFERYAFDETAPGSVSVMTLLAGGVRVKAGLIGTRRQGAVSVNTPVATVTVLGKQFALSLCGENACQVRGRDRALGEGLYAGVIEGAINVANNTGDTTVARGDVVRIRDADAGVEAAPEARTLVFSDAELAALRIEVDRPLGFWAWFKQRFFGIDQDTAR